MQLNGDDKQNVIFYVTHAPRAKTGLDWAIYAAKVVLGTFITFQLLHGFGITPVNNSTGWWIVAAVALWAY
jgi:hypothetical protein